MTLILLSLVVVIAACAAACFVGVLDPKDAQGAISDASQARADTAMRVLDGVLSAARLIAPAATLLAAVTMAFAAALSLASKLGEVGALVSAFFWALVLLVLVMPWQTLLPGHVAVGCIPAADELARAASAVRGGTATSLQTGLFYARFIAYPGFAFAIWVMVLVMTIKGFRAIAKPPSDEEIKLAPADRSSTPVK